jgi:Transposase IS66 family
MHVHAKEHLTHSAVYHKRGKAALDAIGILADFQGVRVHDGWRSYWQVLCQSEGYQANPPDPPPETGRRGRRKQSTARNLLDRLSKHQEAVLLFLDTFAVPFDTSLAERAIRMVKVQQKVSGCFRSEAFAQAFCRIHGSLSTLRKQDLAVLTALEQVLVGHFTCFLACLNRCATE